MRVCVIAAVVALPASAQTLVPGTWAGTLRVAGASPIAVELVVQRVGDSVAATMKTRSGPTSPVTDLKLGDAELAFRWGAFVCSLQPKGDRTYEGSCTTADGTAGQLSLNAPKEARPVRASRDLVTEEDLARTGASNLYDALQKLHPGWLRPRTPSSSVTFPPVVLVYLNDQQVGGVEFLHTFSVAGVTAVRFYSASDATLRWGGSNTGGAIAITQRAF